MRGTTMPHERPLVHNTITVSERHDAEPPQCVNCGEPGHGADVCVQGYRGVAAMVCAEMAAAGPPLNAAPVNVQVACHAASESRLSDAAWQATATLPPVPVVALRREAARVQNWPLSRKRGVPMVGLAAFACAVGAVKPRTRKRNRTPASDDDDSDDSDGESDATAKAERRALAAGRRLGRLWAVNIYSKHADLGAQQGKATAADLAPVSAQVQGGKMALHVPLAALVALYGA
jgi:hypothetical protein